MGKDIIEKYARELLDELQINSLPIMPQEIAEKLGILVQAKPSNVEGVSGMLLKSGDNFGIIYATHIDNEGYQRYSISHELGHYTIPGHPEHVFANGRNLHMSTPGSGNDSIEREADMFAAALLMPSHLVRHLVRNVSPDLASISNLQEVCITSLEAAALRFAELTDSPLAVIRSEGTQIEYCFMSEAFKAIKGLMWIKKSAYLPRATQTYKLNMNASLIQNQEKQESLSCTSVWFNSDFEHELREEVIGMGNYGKSLTILTCEERDEDFDDEEFEDSIKFR